VEIMTRVVRGVVDGGGIYFSRVAAGAGYAFFAGTAVDPTGEIHDSALVKPPYHQSPSAQVRAQTAFIFSEVKRGLEEVGSSIEDVCQVEQYIQYKSHADGYLETSRGPWFMERNRPGSALMETGDFVPDGVVVTPTGIAVIPEPEARVKEILSSGLPTPGVHPEMGDSYTSEAPYSEIVVAGPYVFNTVWASDYATGVHPEVKIAQWVWWGNEARNEIRFNLQKRLKPRLEHVGSELANVVHATVYLTEVEDLYEVDRAWKEAFPTNPPARTVIPVRGLGSPRWEGARTHRDGGTKTEAIFQSIRPGFGAERTIVSGSRKPIAHESAAVAAGGLLWLSGQLAGDEDGLLSNADSLSQARCIFDRLEEVCQAAGTNLSNLVRLRAFVTDIEDAYIVYQVLKERVPIDPPTVAITTVPGPLYVPDCRMIIDGVALVERP
jgi:enamine deaminase RidA (YjgF/YER057c/UK114 family)